MDITERWEGKCFLACHGRAPETAAILLAVLHISPRPLPAYADTSVVTADGLWKADFKDKDGFLTSGKVLGKVETVVGQFQRLADAAKLDDAERLELFTKLQQWVAVDYRAMGKANLE